MGTYTVATQRVPHAHGAIGLYSWNAQISAAFMYPLHLCEVVIRNAVSEALAIAHGPRWPWDQGFLLSLPQPAGQNLFRPRDAVVSAADKATRSARGGTIPSTDKAIAEMSFAFWESMFTKRFDPGIWQNQLMTLFPNTLPGMQYFSLRAEIYQALGTLRKLRNRIAHHEPIFSRPLEAEFLMIERLIRYRCNDTADWLLQTQEVQRLLSLKPI